MVCKIVFTKNKKIEYFLYKKITQFSHFLDSYPRNQAIFQYSLLYTIYEIAEHPNFTSVTRHRGSHQATQRKYTIMIEIPSQPSC